MNLPPKSATAHRWALLALFGLALAAGVADAAAPLGPVWTNQYELPDKRNHGSGVLVDGTGNAYSLFTSGEEGNSVAHVAKFNTAGQRLWISALDSEGSVDYLPDGQLDGAESIVVVGNVREDFRDVKFVVAKYSSSGELLWNTTYDRAVGSPDSASAVALDAAGNVYIAGSTTNPDDDTDDALLLKLSGEDGTTLWEATIPGNLNKNQVAFDVVADASGGVFIAGRTRNTTITEMLAAKFDAANGAGIWTSTYSAPGDESGLAQYIALSGTGVIVAGHCRGSESYDFITLRFNAADGQRQWVSRYDGPKAGSDSMDDPYALAVDSHGNPIVTGISMANGAALGDYATVKYDANTGAQLWLARYDGPGAESDPDFTVDTPYDVEVDAADNVYVTGEVVVAGLRYDIGTIKYNAAGQRQWVHHYNYRGFDDLGGSLGIDAAGNVYVNGTVTLRVLSGKSLNETGVVLLKYLPTGLGVAPGPRIPKPTFTFSETATEKEVCYRDEEGVYCNDEDYFTCKLTATATLQGVDTTLFNKNTYFTTSVDRYGIFNARLGDDPRYTPGKTSVNLSQVISGRKIATILVSWKSGKLKVTIASTKASGLRSVTESYLDKPSGPIEKPTTASIQLSNFYQAFDITLRGKVTTRTSRRDPEVTLSTVSVKATSGTPI